MTSHGCRSVSLTSEHQRIARQRFDRPPQVTTDRMGEGLPEPVSYASSGDDSDISRETYGDRSTTRQQDGMSISNGWTGISTDRSSVFSLTECEYERRDAVRVQKLFEDVSAVLFESSPALQRLQDECGEWNQKFPHIRVVGRQVVEPQDSGIEMISGKGSPQSNLPPDQMNEAMQALHSLSVTGQQMFQLMQESSDDANVTSVAGEDEEIFAQDGVFEETIAIDSWESEDEDGHQYRSGFPPVTPQACIRDNLTAAVIEPLWRQTVSMLRDLIQRLLEVELSSRSGEEFGDVNVMSSRLFTSNTSLHHEASTLSNRITDKSFTTPMDRENKRSVTEALICTGKTLQTRGGYQTELAESIANSSSASINQTNLRDSVKLPNKRKPADKSKSLQIDDRPALLALQGRNFGSEQRSHQQSVPFSRHNTLPPLSSMEQNKGTFRTNSAFREHDGSSRLHGVIERPNTTTSIYGKMDTSYSRRSSVTGNTSGYQSNSNRLNTGGSRSRTLKVAGSGLGRDGDVAQSSTTTLFDTIQEVASPQLSASNINLRKTKGAINVGSIR